MSGPLARFSDRIFARMLPVWLRYRAATEGACLACRLLDIPLFVLGMLMKSIHADDLADELGRATALVCGAARDAVQLRLQSASDSLLEESWLPLGLRSILGEELAVLRSRVKRGRITWQEFADCVGALLSAAEAYGAKVRGSRVLGELRLLDAMAESQTDAKAMDDTSGSPYYARAI